MMALLGLRIADDSQASVRWHRSCNQSVRQQAGRHRPVQVRRMEEGPVHPPRPQSRTTGRRGGPTSTASWPASSPIRAPAARPWKRARSTTPRFNAIPNIDLARLKKLPNIVVTTEGYEMQSPILQLDFNTLRKPYRRRSRPPGDRLRDRPQVRHRQDLVRLCAASRPVRSTRTSRRTASTPRRA